MWTPILVKKSKACLEVEVEAAAVIYKILCSSKLYIGYNDSKG